jgi:hypothetical protein
MPERLATTSPFKPIGEVVGSGPHRFPPQQHGRSDLEPQYAGHDRRRLRFQPVPTVLGGCKKPGFSEFAPSRCLMGIRWSSASNEASLNKRGLFHCLRGYEGEGQCFANLT